MRLATLTLLLLVLGCSDPSGDSERLDQAGGQSSERLEVPTAKVDLATARRKLKIGDYDVARDITQKLILRGEEDRDVLVLLAAQVEAASGEPTRAIDLASEIDLKASNQADAAARLIVQQAKKQGDRKRVESTLLEVLSNENGNESWHHRELADLYRESGRFQESSEQLDLLARLGEATKSDLIAMVRRNDWFPASPDSKPKGFDESSPLLRARWYVAVEKYENACDELRPVVYGDAPLPAESALYLRALAELQNESEFQRLIKHSHGQLDQYADYWLAISKWMIDQSSYQSATAALLRVVEIDYTSRIAFQRLNQTLKAIDRQEDAEQFRHLGLQIAYSETMGRRVYEGTRDPGLFRDLAGLMLEIGRPIEALEWTRQTISANQTAQQMLLSQKRSQVIQASGTESIAVVSALLGLRASEFEDPDAMKDLLRGAGAIRPSIGRSDDILHTPQLVNVAKQVNADFQWYHDDNIALDPIALYESLGGGIAVLDYDLDGWPDLYFAQGGGKPTRVPMSRSNELRRNLKGRFQEVTERAEASDFHYSSGMAAGDVNQDGFPDLYLGAMGTNRLLINNGDGTFHDATGQLGEIPDCVTASVAIADLDGDAIADLFESNYVEIAEGFREPSRDAQGRWELPSPALFLPEPDRVLQQSPTGGFKMEVLDQDEFKPATGLGIVVTDIDGQTGNEVFVGNDMRENHLLRFRDGRFSNLANSLGVATGSQGLANGCMGIATGDFDRNGMFDMHVGNYRSESDNHFLQSMSGGFRDRATAMGLSDLSKDMVTFGTKTLDFDRNGWLDLIVTNGHIFDMDFINQGYKMKPGLMMSNGNEFRAIQVEDSSGYWGKRYLGRAMAMLDFNRNGRMDLVIGHLETPSALLDNQTKTEGHHVMLELVGTQSERDAIGARVVVTAGGRQTSQWVTAGDGYFCTDEPVLDLTVTTASLIESIEVDWPSGQKSFFQNVRVDQRYLVVEGNDELLARDVELR